ncbi:MAG: hypothetical protein GWN30_04935, partial [Gammaproteobacteria bacterium]|nr:hypothetical protein [Gammaproteobacteria bacterium]
MCEHIPAQELPNEEFPLLLTTGRVLYHWHGAEMTRRVDGLLALYPESQVELNTEDALKFGIGKGAQVRLTSRRGEMVAKAFVTDRI